LTGEQLGTFLRKHTLPAALPLVSTLDTPTLILLTLLEAEDIAIAYYYRGIQTFVNPSDPNYQALMTGVAYFDTEVLTYLQACYQEEVTHANYLRGLLGSNLVFHSGPNPNAVHPIAYPALNSNEPQFLVFDNGLFTSLSNYIKSDYSIGNNTYEYGLDDIEDMLTTAYASASFEFSGWAWALGLGAQVTTAGVPSTTTFLNNPQSLAWAAEWAASVFVSETMHSVFPEEGENAEGRPPTISDVLRPAVVGGSIRPADLEDGPEWPAFMNDIAGWWFYDYTTFINTGGGGPFPNPTTTVLAVALNALSSVLTSPIPPVLSTPYYNLWNTNGLVNLNPGLTPNF